MRATTSISVLSLALISAFALTGCSTAGESSGGGGKLSYEDSPLATYTSALWGGMDQEKLDKQTAQIQDLVVACMKKEGFEYNPDSGNGVMINDDYEERETEKWVATNGYGMLMEPGISGEEYVDPNQEYLASLSEGEQTAYYEVLYGPGPSEEEMAAMEEGEDFKYDWKTAGCTGAAQNEIEGDSAQAYDDPKYASLFEKMNTLYTKAAEDPAMKKLDAEWSDCMADAGYSDFATKSAAIESISTELNAFYEGAEVDAEGNVIEDEAAKDELKQKEIDVALADFKCAEKTDYMQQSLKVQFKLEEQYLADNKSELDAMLAEYAKGK